jgi:hypothetical protein
MSQISPRKMPRTLAAIGLTMGCVGLGLVAHAVTAPAASAVSWGDLVKLLAPNRRSGTSRNGAACPVMMEALPTSKLNLSASDQPTLVWMKGAKRVELQVLGEDKPFWQTEKIKAMGKLRLVSYQGEPLQPGVTYEWVIHSPRPLSAARIRFQVDPEKRQELAEKLQSLSGKDEDTLNQRMDVYGKLGLGNDGLKELLDYASPSTGLQQQIQELGKNWCSPPKEVVLPQMGSRR